MDKKEIEKAVRKLLNLKEAIPEDIYLIMLGAATLVLRYDLSRDTGDIDVFLKRHIAGVGAILAEKGFHVVSEALLYLHPDYADRLVPIAEKGKIHIYSVGPYDLAITKIGRCQGEDVKDIMVSSLIDQVDISKLKKLYLEAVEYWVGPPERFKNNWLVFEDHYENKKAEIFRKTKRSR